MSLPGRFPHTTFHEPRKPVAVTRLLSKRDATATLSAMYEVDRIHTETLTGPPTPTQPPRTCCDPAAAPNPPASAHLVV